jgi:hypothetical protein
MGHRRSEHRCLPNTTADAMVKEFTARALPNSHFVAAGVVGINRAQEHGYTLIYAG